MQIGLLKPLNANAPLVAVSSPRVVWLYAKHGDEPSGAGRAEQYKDLCCRKVSVAVAHLFPDLWDTRQDISSCWH